MCKRFCRKADTAIEVELPEYNFRNLKFVAQSFCHPCAWEIATIILPKGVLHIMKTVTINETQRALLFKNGKFKGVLESGKYVDTKNRCFVICRLDNAVDTSYCPVEIMLRNEAFANAVTAVKVEDAHLKLHFVNGRFMHVLSRGVHAFWNAAGEHTFIDVDVSTPEVDESFPRYLFSLIPASYYGIIHVKEYEKAILYYDKRLVKLLDGGVYHYWKTNNVTVDYSVVDTRLTEKNITGQEMLTKDKVSVRINCVCSYRVTDCLKIETEVDNYEEQLHTALQMALRDFVGRYRLDEILEEKEKMSEYVLEKLKEKEEELFIEVKSAGVKDIILPGEIRDIMNTVLIAEKKAQANVIARREEVASTRSLLNTARLMEENETLYKLKELEYMERICENVGNINIDNGTNIIEQLSKLCGR